MSRRSAGILLHRGAGTELEVLLVHPGGPFWAKRDLGAWTIPKGEHAEAEDSLACAVREFEEETGTAPPIEALLALGSVRQRAGKVVQAWAARGDLDAATVTSNTFELEWPPRSGRMQAFPEVDRAQWFGLEQARARILPAQEPFLDRLVEALMSGATPG